MSRVLQPVIARTATNCMEQLQEGYVAAVAATAGCTVSPMTKDLYGVDMLITRGGEDYRDDEISLGVQLKSTTTLRVDPNKKHFSYQIKERKLFEKLAKPPSLSSCNKILVVMATSPVQRDWSKSTHESLEIQHCCYWRSLVGETIKDGVESPTIHVPTEQVFDSEALTSILDRLDRGEGLS